MLKLSVRFLLFVVFAVSLYSCAKKGRPTGGPKDEDAPLLVTSEPPYETINFNEDEITIYFNEYIKLKDLNKQLVVSPPLKNNPLITPQSTPSKYIRIKILDTLETNTTYIFNFGKSIQDNNEGNELEKFSYVFSTGSYIDSLTQKGNVKDAFKSEKVEDIKVLLYKMDENFNDSIVYRTKPNYVASTLDSSAYKFTNVKDGHYLLIALEDAVSDYLFDPKTDKIGFYSEAIELPNDSIVNQPLSLFKEELPFKFKRAKEFRKGQLIFGYVGNPEGFKISLLSDVSNDFKSLQYFETDKDTINFYHNAFEKDSLNFLVSHQNFKDTLTVRLRKKKLDSLKVNSFSSSVLEFNDTVFFETNNPIIKLDSSKIFLLERDSIPTQFKAYISKKSKKIGLLFDKKYKQNYTLSVLPKAFEDLFGFTNDSIQKSFKTKDIEDYGKIILNIQNPKNSHIIVELTNSKDELILREKLHTSGKVEFKNLLPKKYKVRLIYDANNNGRWDTGNYLQKIQPERVEYYSSIFEVRANFDNIEFITINE